MAEFYVIIPARLESRRLPNKPLLEIAGKPLIQHVYENAVNSEAKRVWVATDSEEIAACVRQFGGEVCMTSAQHHSGTDRVAEAAEQLNCAGDSIIVNVQGDEVFIDPEEINSVAQALTDSGADIATLAVELAENRMDDPSIVKVVCNQHNSALYFSRAPIPYKAGEGKRNELLCRRHLGIYAYRREYLDRFKSLSVASLEREESLEQLRALVHGHTIFVKTSSAKPGSGIDTVEDLAEAKALLGG